MDQKPCNDNGYSETINKAAEPALARICAALDTMSLLEVRHLVDEIETELAGGSTA